MKTLKFLTLLSVYALSLLVAPAFAVDGIDDNDHAALVKYYETMANEAKVHLEENKALLEDYEARPCFYGRQGQDVQSHATANIREYERQIKENVHSAELHQKMAREQYKSVNNTKSNLENDSIVVR